MAEATRTPLSPRESEPAAGTLVPGDGLKPHLPGVEPERRLNDWGRSERIEGIFDRLVADFYYRYWFRAEVEGIDNVPSTGGAGPGGGEYVSLDALQGPGAARRMAGDGP